MRPWRSAALLLILAACNVRYRTPTATPPTDVHHIGSRTYVLHRPARATQGHPALVVVLHGATLSAAQTERYYHWDELADAQGFAVAYPQGIDDAWNAGSCCSDAPSLGTDDVAFLDAILADATAQVRADTSRIFMTGVSNGAMMTLRYECVRPARLAAIGSVAGTYTSSCDHPPPIPFIAIHGLADTAVPYLPGTGTVESGTDIRLPARESIERLEAADGCRNPITTTNGAVHVQTAQCAEDVEVITVDGAGHQWPGATIDAARLAQDGPDNQPSTALDATGSLWRFFSTHALPSA
ncbi:MAG: CE1 family esterase [Acidimicrobiales bacterium]